MTEDHSELEELFTETNSGAVHMFKMLQDPGVMQITVNRYDRIFFLDQSGNHAVTGRLFSTGSQYNSWLNALLELTDVGYNDVTTAKTSVIEGSFDPSKTNIHGSIHIATKEITRGDPVLTIRKQPRSIVTLDDMMKQHMMSADMRLFLEQAIRGRSNILISGGSGAGKTTMARALSWYVAPEQHIITIEEIDELHLQDRLPNVAALTTYKHVDEKGTIIRRTSLEDLVREALRMRADRIWVGETRGREAYSLVKACNSGHDGSITTIHADNAQQAVKQVVTYVMESGLTEEVARDQVGQAFHLVIQINKVKMGQRVVSEITEIEPVREGTEQRRNPLFTYRPEQGGWSIEGRPTKRLLQNWGRYGVNFDN